MRKFREIGSEVYVIPRSALRNNSEVIIINEEGTIARRSVKVVWKQGEDIVISEGISDRELRVYPHSLWV